MLFVSIPIWLVLQVTTRVKFHQAVYTTMAMILLKFAYAEVKLASEGCLKEHNKISSKIEFMSNCEKDDPKKKDKDSEDAEEHQCFIMRWYCARECTSSAYGGKCVVESLFTLNLEEDDEGNPETLDCVCEYKHYKRGCLSTYQIEWSTVENEFNTICSKKQPVIPKIMLIGGGFDEPAKSTMEIFSTEMPKENVVVEGVLLKPRSGHVSFVLNNEIIVTVGGYGNDYLSDCETYNLMMKKTTHCNILNTARGDADVAFLNGIPYVCGGIKQFEFLSSCECYISDVWKYGPEMSTERKQLAMASLEGCLYAIGGYNGKTLDTVERYSKQQNEWLPVASMQNVRYKAAATKLDGLLYVCGGEGAFGTLRSCESFNPKDPKWVRVKLMNFKRTEFNLVTVGDYFYAIGGETLKVERYDPKNKEWTTKGNIIHDRFGSSAVVLH